MEQLEKLKHWLMTYPGWEGALWVDHTQAAPGNFGLYPQGVQLRSMRKDVLGNVYAHCRSTFLLYRVTAGQADNTDPAGWLMDFQSWVQAQAAQGLVPRFGDDPQAERFSAQQGRLQKASQTGTGTYAVTLTAEYTKIYQSA